MELPFEKKQPTMADLKQKDLTFNTEFYEFTNAEGMNQFVADMEYVVNNPLRKQIMEFDYQTQVDGSPFALLRYKTDGKVEEVKEKKFFIFAKLFTKFEFNDLDAIINRHDKTTLYLLGEKHLTMKTGDFFILLIWATIEKPTKFTEGLDALRSTLLAKLR